MQISHPAALVSSTELNPDQQPQHILRQQSPKGLSFPHLSPHCISLHSFPFCPLLLLKNPCNCGLFCIWPLSTSTTTTPSPLRGTGRCCCPCAYSERNGLLSLLLPVTEGHAGLPPLNKASAIVIICIDA